MVEREVYEIGKLYSVILEKLELVVVKTSELWALGEIRVQPGGATHHHSVGRTLTRRVRQRRRADSRRC